MYFLRILLLMPARHLPEGSGGRKGCGYRHTWTKTEVPYTKLEKTSLSERERLFTVGLRIPRQLFNSPY